jgi:hypothetical protein
VTELLPGKGKRVAGRGYLFRFLLQLCAVFAFGALLLFAALFFFFSRPIQGDYSSVFFALRHLTEFSLPMVSFSALVYVLLVCGATAVVCIYAIHKVAGPLYRMARVIENYLADEPIRPVSFRKGDQATVLATSFNGFLGRLREDRQEWLGIMERAEEVCRKEPGACRAGMEKAVADLSRSVSKYH